MSNQAVATAMCLQFNEEKHSVKDLETKVVDPLTLVDSTCKFGVF